MKRLGFVLFVVVTGCIDSSELIDESLADEQTEEAANTTEATLAHVGLKLDPFGSRCGVAAPPALEAEWLWGDNGMPIGLQVDLSEPVDTLTVEIQIHDGATHDAVETQRVEVDGRQVFMLSTQMLAEAADNAAKAGVPFGSVSATIMASDGDGEAIAAGNASTVHFQRDQSGKLAGFTPRAAAAALQEVYPERVLIGGVEPKNTYVQVYQSNPGE